MLKKLVKILTPMERKQAVLLVFLAFIGSLAEAIGIGAVFPFINVLTNPEAVHGSSMLDTLYQYSGAHGIERFVLLGSSILLFIYVCKNLYLAWLYFLQARFVYDVEARLCTELLDAYIRAPYTTRLGDSTSERIRLITSEVSRTTGGVMSPLISLITEGIVIISITLLLLYLQPLATMVVLGTLTVVVFLFLRLFRARLSQFRDLVASSHSRMFKSATQGLSALKEIKVLGREEYFIDGFRNNVITYTRATGNFTILNQFPRLLVETLAISVLLIIVIVWIGTNKSAAQIVPTITLFGLAAVRVMPSVTRIISAINRIRFCMPAIHAVQSRLDLTKSNDATDHVIIKTASKCNQIMSLELKGVSYRYPNSPGFTLRNINLHITHGELVVIAGRSGSGKTTLVDMLLGLLDPQEGEIRINGKVVSSLVNERHGITGLVPQHCFLLDDTIRRNVAFGVPDKEINDDRVWRSLTLANLEEKVRSIPDLLDTQVGEHGETLSGGERQRLNIARALYDDPDILIFDEATSSLDATTEAAVIGSLKSLAGYKTIILVTHRLSVVAGCKRVVLMHDGQIVADAAFQDLVKNEPMFSALLQVSAPASALTPSEAGNLDVLN